MRTINNLWAFLWVAGLRLIVRDGVALGEAVRAQTSTQPLTNVAQFYGFARTGYNINHAVQLEGMVCWVDASAKTLILQDHSGAVPISADFHWATIRPGQQVRVEGDCAAQRRGWGFVMTQALAVDNDGLHAPTEKAGSVYLKAGLNPICLDWFNSQGRGVLKVSYEGPGVPRLAIPPEALFRVDGNPADGATNLVPGLNYRSWEGAWDFVPDFSQLSVAASGVATGFDVSVSTRPQSVGLEFTGYLNVPQDGRYTFYTESDDGSLLFVGPPSLQLTALGATAVPRPPSLALGRILTDEEEFHRFEVEGEVTFVEERNRGLRLELKTGEDHLVLEIAQALGAHPRLLQGSRLRATGICHSTSTLDGRKLAGYVWTPSWTEVEVLAVAPDRWELQPLVAITNLATTGGQPQTSALVRVRGQVRSVGTDRSMVVEDQTGKVTVYHAQEPGPPGATVEVVGTPDLNGDRMVLKNGYFQAAISDAEAKSGKLPLLTTIGQVRRLSPEAAGLAYPVRVRGVVTAKFENGANLVVQDADQGLYVRVPLGDTRGRLEIGDACEITATTCSAVWAPTIEAQRVVRLGLGRLPDPLRPSWDQILNGSLDSQYIELEGIVTEVHESGVKLLTRVGRIEMDLGGKSREEWLRFEDALVRIRGCVFAVYDRATSLAVSGKIRFIHPAITVDEFPPADPFAITSRRVASLRAFDPQASAFQRVKVTGQIVHAHNGLYCLMEGTNGLRFFPKQAMSLPAGTSADVVGILDLSGPSPSLHEAMVRPGRSQELPEAMELTGANLLSGAHDATLVRVESLLLNVSRDAGDQVLGLRTGPHVHTARLNTNLGHVGEIPIGSRLALTGVYLGKGGNWAAGQDIERFDLQLNSAAAIAVLAKPSWWTPRRLLGLAGSLAGVLVLAAAWITLLRRQVDERTRELAQQIQARERIEQQRAVEQERVRLARDLHDDLGGGLTEISMLGFLASDRVVAAERKAGYLQQMTEKARQLVTALDEIVWAVNPRYDSLASLAGYYSLYAQRFLGLASLPCHLEIAETLPDCPLDSKVRHSLFLAFKEALNNVVRHAEASEVRLRIQMEGDELIVAVTDNGRGLQSAAATASGMDGLANMRARLSALGGRCEIRSVPAQGTTVLFGLRVPKVNYD